MNNLFKSKYKILQCNCYEKGTITGAKKQYYVVKIYMEFCENIVSCFISKEIYEQIKKGTINDTNVIEHLYLKIDKDMVCHVFIK